MPITAQELLAAANTAGLDTPQKAEAALRSLAHQAEVVRLTAVIGRLRSQLAQVEANLRAAEAARDGALGANGG